MRCRSDDSSIGARLGAFLVKFRRYGSGPADLVRITLKNGHWNPTAKCLLCANSGPSAAQQKLLYSVTRPTRASSDAGSSKPSVFAVLGLQSWGCSLGAAVLGLMRSWYGRLHYRDLAQVCFGVGLLFITAPLFNVSILPGRPMTLLRAIIHNRLPARCAPSVVE